VVKINSTNICFVSHFGCLVSFLPNYYFLYQKSLYDAWVATSKLRESVIAKRTELQVLKQHFKLISILKEHVCYLATCAELIMLYF
jgi:hypothetical protein